MAFALSVVTIAIAVASVHVSAWWFSPGVMILPILAGGLLLWPRALRIFFGFAAAALIYDVAEGKAGAGIIATIVLTAAFADVLARTREELGVQGLRGDRMLLELRDRIRAQGKLPELGEGWGSSLVLKPAGGSSGVAHAAGSRRRRSATSSAPPRWPARPSTSRIASRAASSSSI